MDYEINIEIIAGRKQLKQSMAISKGLILNDQSELSLKGLRKAILQQHGTLNKYIFHITALVPDRVHTHLRTHHLVNEFYTCSTSRPDMTNNNGKIRAIDFYLPIKRLIEISGLRLCSRTWHETSDFWNALCVKLELAEPALNGLLFPRCVSCGYCPELNDNCDYMKSGGFAYARKNLISEINNNNK
jgi:hypothetical protein